MLTLAGGGVTTGLSLRSETKVSDTGCASLDIVLGGSGSFASVVSTFSVTAMGSGIGASPAVISEDFKQVVLSLEGGLLGLSGRDGRGDMGRLLGGRREDELYGLGGNPDMMGLGGREGCIGKLDPVFLH